MYRKPLHYFQSASNNLKAVFQRIRQAGLRLKPKNGKLFSRSTKFLRHVVSSSGVNPNPGKIEAIRRWPDPQKLSEFGSFVGFSSYYRKLFRNFAKIANPSTELTRKGGKFVWTLCCHDAFDKLKYCVTNPPILGYPSFGNTFFGILTLSLNALALYYLRRKKKNVITYSSKSPNKFPKRYRTA